MQTSALCKSIHSVDFLVPAKLASSNLDIFFIFDFLEPSNFDKIFWLDKEITFLNWVTNSDFFIWDQKISEISHLKPNLLIGVFNSSLVCELKVGLIIETFKQIVK